MHRQKLLLWLHEPYKQIIYGNMIFFCTFVRCKITSSILMYICLQKKLLLEFSFALKNLQRISSALIALISLRVRLSVLMPLLVSHTPFDNPEQTINYPLFYKNKTGPLYGLTNKKRKVSKGFLLSLLAICHSLNGG